MADVQDNPQEELDWDLQSLHCLDVARHIRLAEDKAIYLENDSYGNFVKSAISKLRREVLNQQ